MRALCIAMLLITQTLVLKADGYELTKTTIAGRETVSANYVQGKNTRYEKLRDGSSPADYDHQCPRGLRSSMPARITIINFDKQSTYSLDVSSREYVEVSQTRPDLILSLAQWIARSPRFRQSGKIVNVYFEAIDTGERRQFFGRTAKHLLLRERRVAEPGACEQTRQSETDGWYLDPVERAAANRYCHLSGGTFSSGICLDKIAFHGRPSPGIPVLEITGGIRTETLELSNAPLDKRLFEVPAGFRKVDELPGDFHMTRQQRLELEWAQLEQAFQSWFD